MTFPLYTEHVSICREEVVNAQRDESLSPRLALRCKPLTVASIPIYCLGRFD
jgi:hypothetical protein